MRRSSFKLESVIAFLRLSCFPKQCLCVLFACCQAATLAPGGGGTARKADSCGCCACGAELFSALTEPYKIVLCAEPVRYHHGCGIGAACAESRTTCSVNMWHWVCCRSVALHGPPPLAPPAFRAAGKAVASQSSALQITGVCVCDEQQDPVYCIVVIGSAAWRASPPFPGSDTSRRAAHGNTSFKVGCQGNDC